MVETIWTQGTIMVAAGVFGIVFFLVAGIINLFMMKKEKITEKIRNDKLNADMMESIKSTQALAGSGKDTDMTESIKSTHVLAGSGKTGNVDGLSDASTAVGTDGEVATVMLNDNLPIVMILDDR